MPIWIPMLIGAAAGGGLAAAIGPKDEPLWKKMLVGGGLGATAGFGLGAAGVGAGGATASAAPLATPTLAVPGTAAPVGSAAALGLPTSLAPAGATASGAAAAGAPSTAFIGSSGGSAAGGIGSSVAATQAASSPVAGAPITSAQAARNIFGRAATTPTQSLIAKTGAAMANHPYLTAGGLGAAGLLALPGGNSRGRRDAPETYPQNASWEDRRQFPRFYGSPSIGGIGRGFYS